MDGVWGRVVSGSMYSCNFCTCISDVPAMELNFYPSIPSLYARLLIVENCFRLSWMLRGWTPRYQGVTRAKYMYLQKKFLLVLWKVRWKVRWRVRWKLIVITNGHRPTSVRLSAEFINYTCQLRERRQPLTGMSCRYFH